MKEREGIDIVIINYFSVNKIITLLKSIDSSEFEKGISNIIVISNSGESELVKLKSIENICLVENEKNMGFGFACNQSIPYCKNKYLLLLNPDTFLFPNTLKLSHDFMQKHEDIDVLGIKHINNKGISSPAFGTFPKFKNFLSDILGLPKINRHHFKGILSYEGLRNSESKLTGHVMGAFMMIRQNFIEQYGFMDIRYFVFLEDVDFCKKVWDKGGKVFYNADIEIIHEGGASTDNINAQKLCYFMEGKLKYAYKHFPKWQWLILLFMILFVEPFMRIAWGVFTLQLNKISETIRGYLLFFKRRQIK